MVTALAAAYAKSPCGVYRTFNKYFAKAGSHADPPRKFVGSNVSFSNCSTAQQAAIKARMEKGYDSLVGDCWTNLSIPGVDAKTRQKIRNRIVDYLTCEPLQVVCNPPRCAKVTTSCGYFDTNGFWATPKQINLCLSNCPTPAIVHELAHLAEYEIRGTTSESTAVPFGVSCG